MFTKELLQNATITSAQSNGYCIEREGSSEVVQVSVINEHLIYTGNYGCAIIKMNGVKDVLSVFGDHSNNDYILSKVVATDMEHNLARQEMMCDVIRHLASNR